MSMMMRRGMMVPAVVPGGLPAEYLAVQYIQAIPGAYINSGYVPTVAPRIETRIQIMSNSDSDLFGFIDNTFPSFIVDARNYGSIFYNRCGQTPYTQFMPSSQLKTPTDCVFGKTTIIGSNEYIDAFGDVDWSSNVQVVYIGRGRNITCDVRIYSCKLYDGTALVRDLIPCIRIVDSKPGMYDLVGRQFYVNQGTWEFLYELELYPVGTEVLSMYIGDKDNGARRNFASGYAINSSGEYVENSGTYASDVYVPVSSNYTYQKNGNRLITYALYDKDKTFIGMGTLYNNTSTQALDKFADGVCYIRVQAYNYANQSIELTRIE